MPHRRAAAVVRFSSLGDVLLAAHVPGFLKQEDPERRVLFVTKERVASLLRGHPHIDRVYALRERGTDPIEPAEGIHGSLGDLITAMRGDGVEEIVDLHRNWRSSRVLSAFPGTKQRLTPKYALRRRLWVYARWLRPAPVPPLLQTYRALVGLAPFAEPEPWLKQALSDSELKRGASRAGEAAMARGFVLLGTGARWGTKRWPAAHFAELARSIERTRGYQALFAVTPGESIPSEIAGDSVRSLPFRELAAVAAHARGIVSNDSAVLHLGTALGVPSVGLFGSTVPEFGFARQGPRDEVAEIALGCRPCSVHGRRRCPLGHHDCMKRLVPDLVVQALDRATA